MCCALREKFLQAAYVSSIYGRVSLPLLLYKAQVRADKKDRLLEFNVFVQIVVGLDTRLVDGAEQCHSLHSHHMFALP